MVSLFSLIKDYLIDQEDGIRKLIGSLSFSIDKMIFN